MPEPETPKKKYLPAVLMGKRNKGVPKNFSKAERHRRRLRMIAMNKERDAAYAKQIRPVASV